MFKEGILQKSTLLTKKNCFTYHNMQVCKTYLQVQTSKLPCNHYLTNIPIALISEPIFVQMFYKVICCEKGNSISKKTK